MSEHKYTRRGKRIESAERGSDGKPEKEWGPYSSINEAKRASRRFQMHEDRALGLGSLRVE